MLAARKPKPFLFTNFQHVWGGDPWVYFVSMSKKYRRRQPNGLLSVSLNMAKSMVYCSHTKLNFLALEQKKLSYFFFTNNVLCNILKPSLRGKALHQRLSIYLNAQDTCGTPTLNKHNRTLDRLGNLLYLQPQATIKF